MKFCNFQYIFINLHKKSSNIPGVLKQVLSRCHMLCLTNPLLIYKRR